MSFQALLLTLNLLLGNTNLPINRLSLEKILIVP